MPLTTEQLQVLEARYQLSLEEHRRLAPRNGEIPVGGAHMDPFFRAEALRGLLGALRKGGRPREALLEGAEAGKLAIRLWNRRGDYQVHRWDGWVEDYLRDEIRRTRYAKHP